MSAYITAPDLTAVTRLRAQLWERGFRPVPLLSANDPDPKRAGKAPIHKDWTNRARRNPPEAANTPALAHIASTGILCDGLRVIDADIDNASLAEAVEELAIEHFGPVPTRRRSNSSRFAMLYRAAEGEPRKIVLVGAGHTDDHACKIEVLGKGLQFVAYGGHVSGGTLSWTVEPLDMPRDQLAAVTEPQIAAFLAAVAPVIGAEAPAKRKPQTTKGSNEGAGPALAQLKAALALIPAAAADDYDTWIRVGAALHHESQGSAEGMAAWEEWAAKSSKFDAVETEERWSSFAEGGDGAKVSAATIFHLAKPYGWHPPDPADDPGYIAALEADALAEAARTARPPHGHADGQDTAPAGSAGAFGQDEEDGEYGRADAKPPPGAGAKQRILSGADFIARHVPPVWLIDGIVQRGRLYACTSLTGHGKTAVWLYKGCMIHAGRMIGSLDVFKGNVLFLAGENPSDLEARMIGMAKAFDIPPEKLPYVLPGSFPMTEEGAEELKRDIAALGVPLVLIVGDTASSFFPGDDENSNVQAGAFGRTLRSFTKECDGHPALVVLSHPVKNASHSNLLPRGGGAFLNEMDGNLTLWSESPGEVTELHWQGKIRGPDFSAFGYRLRTVATGLIDEKGRPEMTIVAEPMSDEAVADHTKQNLASEDVVLRLLREQSDWSFAQIAKDRGWVGDDDIPEKWRVQKIIRRLANAKLVQQSRPGAPWKLTENGEKALDEAGKGPGHAAKAEDEGSSGKPLTKSGRDALLEHLADLKETDPVEFDAEREAAAKRLGCRMGTLTATISKIIASRAKARASAERAEKATQKGAKKPGK